jgi:hypothetical protein
MAGSQTHPPRGGRYAAALAVAFLTFAGRAQAQNPSPPLPLAATPAPGVAEIVETVAPTEAMSAPAAVPGPTYYRADCQKVVMDGGTR